MTLSALPNATLSAPDLNAKWTANPLNAPNVKFTAKNLSALSVVLRKCVKWKTAQLVKLSAVLLSAELLAPPLNPTALLSARRPSVPGNARPLLYAPNPNVSSLVNNPVAPKRKNLAPLEETAHAALVTPETPHSPSNTPKSMHAKTAFLVPKLHSLRSSTAFLIKLNKAK